MLSCKNGEVHFCYGCVYAAIKWDDKDLCFKPYCNNKKHKDWLKDIDMELWNMYYDKRWDMYSIRKRLNEIKNHSHRQKDLF